MNIKQLHQLFLKSNHISTDTRKVSINSIFFALKGDSFNGNKFASEAIDKGALYAVVDEKEFVKNDPFILVDNVLETLQALALFHRQYLGLKIIALTGSNGKTTTKELINCVLNTTYETVATKGNLNNHIGVPLTLLSMTETTEIGVVEMGANHLKEIEFLCELVQPDFGYITNFGKAHLEGFGSIEGVIKGKSELYDFLKKSNGTVFINSEDEIQKEQIEGYEQLHSFGLSETNNTAIRFIQTNPFVKVGYQDASIQSQLIGQYNFNNVSAAIAIGDYFGVEKDVLKAAIENYAPDNNRSQIIDKGTNKIILDAYNANPTSMKAALDSFFNLNDSSKIAVLGDMFELGKDAHEEHLSIVNYAIKLGFDSIFLVGENFYNAKVNVENVSYFKTYDVLETEIKSKSFENCSFLIKGSRGMALERLLEIL